MAGLRAKGAVLHAITSQPGVAAKVKRNWSLNYAVRSDPNMYIGRELAKRGLPAPVVNPDPPPPGLGDHQRGATPGGEYVAGVYQPAVLVLDDTFQIRFTYVETPGQHSFGGAAPFSRPSASIVLKAVSSAAAGQQPVQHRVSPLVHCFTAIFVTPAALAVMFAAGNFVEPRVIGLDENGHLHSGQAVYCFKLGIAIVLMCIMWTVAPTLTALALAMYLTWVFFRWGTWISRLLVPDSTSQRLAS